jgi:hypothetical protein
MKQCKRCGRLMGILQGNYCDECKKYLPLREQLIEDGWSDGINRSWSWSLTTNGT